ncbi:CCA tRNA nucleotidyltransferase [Geobacter sp. DSM 9736]|uniref:CCA tRNA nucleotidyltransferase n=1 Tax=Geobacter sp. DSM 9736 TaxID=1277350 RepID=UPI000B50151F|nr:CCA tRNA nucleotidyltransferase [Geobacter sp. DSM 9736]SNB45269.1 poly(A) polymerase [Geobacter sp. DSM 9736]
MKVDLAQIFPREHFPSVRQLAAEVGGGVFLVGGALRDHFSGKAVKDLDLAVGHDVAEVLPALLAGRLDGSFFSLDEKRRQSRVVIGRKGNPLTYDIAPLQGSITEDLFRRDFTVNAMAVEVTGSSAEVIDPLRGIDDLRRGELRVCSDSAFRDDPLRLLRAFRLKAEGGYRMSNETRKLVEESAALISSVAAERVRDEIFKMLAMPGVSSSLFDMRDAGLAEHIFQFGSQSINGPVWTQGVTVAGALEGLFLRLHETLPEHAEALEKYLAQDLEGGVVRSSVLKLAPVVASAGSGSVTAAAKRFVFGKKTERVLTSLVERLPGDITPTTRATYRYFADNPAAVELLLLNFAQGELTLQRLRVFLDYIFGDVQAERQELLSGEEIMQLTGVPQGPEVGRIINEVRDAERAGVIHDKADAVAFVKNRVDKHTTLI